ncbi:MAG: hypothetical protein ACRD3W_03550, partial [Terriglobales bacterium]
MTVEEISKRTCRSLEWDRLRTFLAAESETAGGKDLCLALTPEEPRALVVRLLEETNEALSLIQARSYLALGGLPDLAQVLVRLQAGAALNALELLSVRTTFVIARQIKASLSLLSADVFPRLAAYQPRLMPVEPLIAAVETAIDEGGTVKDEASTLLRNLRREVYRLDQQIKEELMKIIRSSTLSKALQEQIYTQRNGRYVLPVDANMRSHINGIVHDSSASGLTVFVEPMAVVELANKMRIKESEIDFEIARILQELSALA